VVHGVVALLCVDVGVQRFDSREFVAADFAGQDLISRFLHIKLPALFFLHYRYGELPAVIAN